MSTARRAIGLTLATVALTVCSWVAAMFVPLFVFPPLGSGAAVIVCQLVVGTLLAGLPLGVSFGLMTKRSPVFHALLVSLAAACLRLGFTIYVVAAPPHWTEWLEGTLLVAVFVGAAAMGVRLAAASHRATAVAGYVTFSVVSLFACAFPWLYGCLVLELCGRGA